VSKHHSKKIVLKTLAEVRQTSIVPLCQCCMGNARVLGFVGWVTCMVCRGTGLRLSFMGGM
jgi:hypothetical protein